MMKDRYKTKIWNKKKQRFEETLLIGIIKDPMIRDYIATDTEDEQINYFGDKCDDLEIINCTGLKDKNGKLIYEGDILTTSEHNLCKENEKYKVFWHKEYCQFLFESINNGYCIDFMDMYKPEVIGNIYEHKDLLNA